MSMLFNLFVVSKSATDMSTPICAVLELRSRANLPCLVNLALSFEVSHGGPSKINNNSE